MTTIRKVCRSRSHYFHITMACQAVERPPRLLRQLHYLQKLYSESCKVIRKVLLKSLKGLEDFRRKNAPSVSLEEAQVLPPS